MDMASRRGELHRIGAEIKKDLVEPQRITDKDGVLPEALHGLREFDALHLAWA